MNKIKLSLFALIAATVVGCGGGGGGGTSGDDNATTPVASSGAGDNNATTLVASSGAGDDNATILVASSGAGDDNGTTPVASSGAGDDNGTTPVASSGVGDDNGTTSVSTATGSVVSDSGVSPAQTYIPFGNGANYYNTLTVLAMDLNKDGVNDVVKFRSEAYDNLYIEALINNGDGTSYTNETSKYFGKIGNKYAWAHDAHVADLNDDGLSDILPFQTGCFHDDYTGTPCLLPMIQQADGSFEVTSNPLLQTLTDGSYMPVDLMVTAIWILSITT